MRPGDRLEKVSIEDGRVAPVRPDRGHGPSIARDGSALYYVTRPSDQSSAQSNWEIRRAAPEDGESTLIATLAGARLPFSPRFSPHLSLSPDGQWLAIPLIDGATTNLWLYPTSGGPPRQATDFGDRSILIARWVSWSPDGGYLFAAVAETDVDVVLLDGILP
jgi:Tol biopolymer transport system component